MSSTGKPQPFGPPLIGALLRLQWEVVRDRMVERLHAQGFDDLIPAHLQVLQWPGPGGARPTELAARLRMTKQALNYLLGDLERLGYLERTADPRDARSRLIAATRRGEQAMRVMRAAVREVEREWQGRLGTKGFETLRALLVQLNEPAV